MQEILYIILLFGRVMLCEIFLTLSYNACKIIFVWRRVNYCIKMHPSSSNISYMEQHLNTLYETTFSNTPPGWTLDIINTSNQTTFKLNKLRQRNSSDHRLHNQQLPLARIGIHHCGKLDIQGGLHSTHYPVCTDCCSSSQQPSNFYLYS